MTPRENEVERQEVGNDAATDDAGFGEGGAHLNGEATES
jgi:hypothetical protein